jgi:hypothetical protein
MNRRMTLMVSAMGILRTQLRRYVIGGGIGFRELGVHRILLGSWARDAGYGVKPPLHFPPYLASHIEYRSERALQSQSGQLGYHDTAPRWQNLLPGQERDHLGGARGRRVDQPHGERHQAIKSASSVDEGPTAPQAPPTEVAFDAATWPSNR